MKVFVSEPKRMKMKRYLFQYRINIEAAENREVDPRNSITVHATKISAAWKMVYTELVINGDIEVLDSIELEYVC